MNGASSHTGFYHALKVDNSLCVGCTHCMMVCPTQAIRIRDGKATIIAERCVDCGNCCKSCPVSAIVVEQDDFDAIFKYTNRVALVPSVLFGQFPPHIQPGDVFGALRSLGFTHVVEIDSMVDLVQQGYDQYMKANGKLKPLISTFCPAIVRLIQVRFPSMVDKLIRIKPPSDIAAIYYREKLEQEGKAPDQIGIFYITPCAAKIAAIKSPVGEQESPVDGVINMEYLYNKLYQQIINRRAETNDLPYSGSISPKGILWSLTAGESGYQKGHCLAVDGIANVSEFLERLEESEDTGIDFLEVRACDESCAGGALISGNRFLTVERLKYRADRAEDNSAPDSYGTFNKELYSLQDIPAKSILVMDPDREEAIRKVRKAEEIRKVLPGIDCGACGSPGCKSLAEDIVQAKADLDQCIFLQEIHVREGRLKLEEADKINASVWGIDRNNRSLNK